MTITIDLKPQVESQIAAQAAAQGLSVEAFVQKLLEKSVVSNNSPDEISLEEFERDMDMLAEGLEHLPINYQGNYSREDIYLDHD